MLLFFFFFYYEEDSKVLDLSDVSAFTATFSLVYNACYVLLNMGTRLTNQQQQRIGLYKDTKSNFSAERCF